MPTLKKGSINDENNGFWFDGYVYPLFSIKFNLNETKFNIPAFGKSNYENYGKIRIRLKEINPQSQEEANEAFKTVMKEQKSKKNQTPYNSFDNLDTLIDEEITRIKTHYGASLNSISETMLKMKGTNQGDVDDATFTKHIQVQNVLLGQGLKGHAEYQKALKIVMDATSTNEAESKAVAQEGKAKAEDVALKASRTSYGMALVAKKMVRQISAERDNIKLELTETKADAEEAKAKGGTGLTIHEIQKILDDTFVNGDPTAEDDGNAFNDDPYIHGKLKFVEVGEDGHPVIKRRPTNEEVNELVKYHNEHAQHQKSMEGTYYYNFTEDDPEVKQLRQQILEQQQQLDQQRVMFRNQLSQHTETKDQLKAMEDELKLTKKQLDQHAKEELAKFGLLPLEEDDDENVAIESKASTVDVIDTTTSSGISIEQRKANRASLRGARKPTNPALANVGQTPISQKATDILKRFALRSNARIRIGKIRQERLNNIATANANRKLELDAQLKIEEDFLNNVGIGSATVPVVDNTPMAKTISSSQDADKAIADASLEAGDTQNQDADYAETDDNMPDVSKFGYGKQVAKFAKEQGRDFTYTMSMVQKSKNAPSQNKAERNKQKERLLAEWGETIGIKKSKGGSYEECLEIYTIVFLAKDMYRIERNWKKATIKYLPLLENLSHQSTQQTNTQTQLGMVTMGQNPMTMEQADELIRQTKRQGSYTRQQQRRQFAKAQGEETKADPNLGRQDSGGNYDDFTDAEEEEGDARRRLGGFGTDVRYSRQQSSAERNPNMGAGVQSVRQIKSQKARPPKRAYRKYAKPKMNVAEAQFKMRKSRINPNLLFVNLDKQNPKPSVDPPTFKTRTNDKKIRRIKF